MPSSGRHIVAFGGGGFMVEPDNPLLDDYVLGLAGAELPRVCFVPTASGDAADAIARFHAAFPPERARATHLPLFARDGRDLRAHVLAQDVVYVGGGNTANLLAVWRVHGVDAVLREAWEAGIVLAGVSAGALCWFEGGVTDSFGGLRRLADGLGLVGGSFCPHYTGYGPPGGTGEEGRREAYHEALRAGLPGGYAVDDGAALHFAQRELVEVVASRPSARAHRVELGPAGGVRETALETRYLG
jgi:dipeptidase E